MLRFDLDAFIGRQVKIELQQQTQQRDLVERESALNVADLVRMKLTSFRLKDRVHIQDMDSVGLSTPEIEALRARLAEVRAEE